MDAAHTSRTTALLRPLYVLRGFVMRGYARTARYDHRVRHIKRNYVEARKEKNEQTNENARIWGEKKK